MSIRRDHTDHHHRDNTGTANRRNNITPKISSPERRLLSTHYLKHPLSLSRRANNAGAAEARSPKQREEELLLRKEKEMMSRLLRTKMEQGKGRRWRTEHAEEPLVLRKNTISSFDNLEFQILKPTDKLFQRLENMRLAERILLARPSLEVKRSELSSFYRRQKNYELHIRKMPARYQSKSKHHRAINKKQWID